MNYPVSRVRRWLDDPVTKDYFAELEKLKSNSTFAMESAIDKGDMHHATLERGRTSGLIHAIEEPAYYIEEQLHKEGGQEE